MIAACPKCTARYRVDESRIGPDGAKLKCSRCDALFRVLAPAKAAPEVAATEPPVAAAPRPAPARAAETPAASTGSPPLDESKIDRTRLVIVADPDVEAGKVTLNQLSAWGLTPILVHDGVEAMLTTQRMLPRVVILDAALPKMYGFQVCEVIKRNESLRHTGVILVGAIHNRDRYRRQPTELYGADHYLEQPDLPDGLGPLFERMGIELTGGTTGAKPAPAPAPVAEPAPVAVSAPPEVEVPAPRPAPVAPAPLPTQDPPSAPAADGGNPALAEERANAERLARIIVSDIALYQPDKFAQGIRDGNPLDAVRNEIEEGRSLFAQRVSEEVRAERDFIADELIRVARERGMS